MVTTSRAHVTANLATIRDALSRACAASGRPEDAVRIVAAAKGVPAEVVGWVVDAGVRDIGDNHVKELRDHAERTVGARWHFIGTLQSHTAHHVAALADVVQTLASPSATRRLGRRAAEAGRTIEALIEVDFTGSRTGVAPDRVAAFAGEVAEIEGLRLIGLMTVPPITPSPEDARPYFARLRDLAERLRDSNPELRELSMGMSQDYPVAAAEGATMVRIGTALFGERPHA